MTRHFRDQKGFTLIEMIIVIIIMGILAAVIIPQVSMTTEDAKLSTLKADLGALRNSVEIYYVQHDNTYPGAKSITGGTPADAAAAATAFVQQLTRYTEKDCTVSDTKTADAKYGPYVKVGGLPENPYNNDSNVVCDITENNITVRASGGGTQGWKFYTITGVLIANDGAHDTL